MPRISSCLAAILICLISTAQAAEDRALFWEVKSDTTSITLLGSIHFADDSFYPVRKIISDSFDAADYLVVEVDLTSFDPYRYLSLISRYGRYPQGISIENQVSAETYRRLQKALLANGMAANSMDNVRPGMVVMDLTSLVLVDMGYTASNGIDMTFMKRAKQTGKQVIQLETLEQQIKLFAGLPDGDLFLSDALDELDHAEKELAALEQAWKSGDEEKLERMFIDEPEQQHESYAGINDIMLYQRNRRMLKKLKRYLGLEKKFFVVVGAAHMLGEQGLVSMLERAGYEVTRR